jgi:hypothetical protein
MDSRAASTSAVPPEQQQPHVHDRSVQVAVRARPLVPRERLEGAQSCISVDEARGALSVSGVRHFAFDAAFGPGARQADVHAACVSRLVDAVLQGFNATVLAFGPTGACGGGLSALAARQLQPTNSSCPAVGQHRLWQDVHNGHEQRPLLC